MTPRCTGRWRAVLVALLVALGGSGTAAALTPTASPTPLPARVAIGTVNALAGTDVEVPVTLDPGDQSVFLVRNDIEFDALTPVRRTSPGGPPDCTANPELAFTGVAFTCIGATCPRVRAILQRLGGMALPAATLYTCAFSIDPAAAVGTYPLTALGVLAENALNSPVPSAQQDGAIIVVLELPPTPTETETRTPTLTHTVTETPSPTETATIGNSPTPTDTRTATPTRPTSTATTTLTPTVTLTPTATRTLTPTRTRLPFVSPTPTSGGATNTAPLLSIGNAVGVPGGAVTIAVTIDPGDQVVIGAQNTISFDAFLRPARLGNGKLDCAVNLGLGALSPPSFECANPDCSAIQASVFLQLGAGQLPAALLYTCTVLVDPLAPVDMTQALTMPFLAAYGPTGTALPTSGNNGAILILASLPPTATPTLTRTRTSTATPSPPPTATSTGPTETPSATPTTSATATHSITPTSASTATVSETPTPSATRTTTLTRTATPTRSITPTATPTGTATGTRTGTLTRTPTITGSRPPSPTPTPTPTRTATGTPADTPTRTPTRTASASRTATETPTPSQTRTATPTRTARATETESATPGATPTGTTSETPGPSPTPTPSPQDTPTATPSAVPATHTPVSTATHSPTTTPPPSPTATVSGCHGDCDGNGVVSIDELVLAVNISLGLRPVSDCRSVDRNGSGEVTIDEIIVAIANAQNGCGRS